MNTVNSNPRSGTKNS